MPKGQPDPFDFTDLSDLPADLARRLQADTDEHVRIYADIVAQAAVAGHAELDINRIMAAALRMGIAVPSQQVVRGYLNRAVQLGLIVKPTRQSYGAVTASPDPPLPADPVRSGRKTRADPLLTHDPDDDPLAALNI